LLSRLTTLAHGVSENPDALESFPFLPRAHLTTPLRIPYRYRDILTLKF
jgi:hypothetical protein